MPSSGIPLDWAATPKQPGIAVVPEPSPAQAARIVRRIHELARPGDLVVVSIHWGSNWGHEVPQRQVEFAHALVDGGVDVVHGHSSHHPRPIEVYRGRLILYGCGDLVDDYEGITGHERYRDDLRLLYVASVEPGTGALAALRMTPLRARRLRLRYAAREDAAWLRDMFGRTGERFGSEVDLAPDGALTLRVR